MAKSRTVLVNDYGAVLRVSRKDFTAWLTKVAKGEDYETVADLPSAKEVGRIEMRTTDIDRHDAAFHLAGLLGRNPNEVERECGLVSMAEERRPASEDEE